MASKPVGSHHPARMEDDPGTDLMSEPNGTANSNPGEGGFASNPELAREAGRKGGETVKERYGVTFYQEIGRKGGETVKNTRGPEFYAEIGRKGGETRGARAAAAAQVQASPTPPTPAVSASATAAVAAAVADAETAARKRGRPKKEGTR